MKETTKYQPQHDEQRVHFLLRRSFAIAYGKTLLGAAKKPTEAAELISNAMKQHPNDKLVSEVLPLLIAAYAASDQIEKLVGLLADLAKNAPPADRPGILMTLANRYMAVSKIQEAAGMYRGVVALRASTPDQRAQATYQLALCYWQSGMKEAAKRAMLQVIRRYPTAVAADNARGTVQVWDMSTKQ